MEEIVRRVLKAQDDTDTMENLVKDYIPFIKAQAAKGEKLGLEYDDRLSLAMMVFVNCVKQYKEERGGFIGFTSACIYNRLVDEARKRKEFALPLDEDPADSDKNLRTVEQQASLEVYGREREQTLIAEEIQALSQELAPFEITFKDLARVCPKQKRSRNSCIDIAKAIVQNEALSQVMFKNHRLPQAQVASLCGVSEKTLEKYRRYIIALVVIFKGEYPAVKAFIPTGREGD